MFHLEPDIKRRSSMSLEGVVVGEQVCVWCSDDMSMTAMLSFVDAFVEGDMDVGT